MLSLFFFSCRTTDIVPEDFSMETDENIISPPDPSLIDDPVISDYNVPSDSEEDSIVDEAPSVNCDSDSETVEWEVIEEGTERGNMYFLFQISYKETRDVNRQVKLVSEGKVLRYQRNRYVRQHGVIAKALEDFDSDSITLKELLRICGRLNGPVV